MSFLKFRVFDVTDFDREPKLELEFRGKSFELTIGRYKVSLWITKLTEIYK